MARCFAIRGAEVEGQRLWKGKLDLCLANDEAATPVEISILRRGARIQLELVEESSRSGASGLTVRGPPDPEHARRALPRWRPTAEGSTEPRLLARPRWQGID